MRQIPALITPGGETITESAAILVWLAEQHPEAALGPEPGDPRRAQFLRWMSFVPASIYSLFWVRDEPSRLGGDDPAAQERIKARTAERIAHCWGVMESQIAPGRFLLGEALTVLDLYVAVASRWTPRRRRFAEVAPRMHAVVERVDALPELSEFWRERFPGGGARAWRTCSRRSRCRAVSSASMYLTHPDAARRFPGPVGMAASDRGCVKTPFGSSELG